MEGCSPRYFDRSLMLAGANRVGHFMLKPICSLHRKSHLRLAQSRPLSCALAKERSFPTYRAPQSLSIQGLRCGVRQVASSLYPIYCWNPLLDLSILVRSRVGARQSFPPATEFNREAPLDGRTFANARPRSAIAGHSPSGSSGRGSVRKNLFPRVLCGGRSA